MLTSLSARGAAVEDREVQRKRPPASTGPDEEDVAQRQIALDAGDAGERGALAGGLRLVARRAGGERKRRQHRDAGESAGRDGRWRSRGAASSEHRQGASDNPQTLPEPSPRQGKFTPKPGRVRSTAPHRPARRACVARNGARDPGRRPSSAPDRTSATAATSAIRQATAAAELGSRGPKASTADAASSSDGRQRP